MTALGTIARVVGGRLVGADTAAVTGITHDSRRVEPGSLFCCVAGFDHDGHDFAGAAAEAGAAALLVQRHLDVDLPQVIVDDVRRAMGPAAAEVHGHPSQTMHVVGVTGTNGKTTTVHLLGSILEASGWRSATIGTLTGARTTPEATDLQARLAALRADGTDAVAMEVSSHALSLHRVDGTRFEVAIFTNLSSEHLDFHGSLEDYFRAKARLFTAELSGRAVVNLDDPRGRLLRDAASIPTEGFSLADAEHLEMTVAGSRFVWRGVRVELALPGRFNVANALGAAAAAVALGLSPDVVAAGLAAAPPARGRFERVDAGQPYTVVVDYAHTPDGLDQALATARELVGTGRVLVVFGAGGDRDRGKRPAMGAVACRRADLVVLTSDNPRSEDPLEIIDAVRAGCTGPAELVVEPDRRAAIGAALDRARPGDLVLLAGKGHETVQVIGDESFPFDDRAVARGLLEGRGAA